MKKEEYKADLNKAYEDSRILINPKSENQVTFILKENISKEKIGDFFKDFPEEVKIEIYNPQQHKEELEAVQIKYADFLSKNPGLGTGHVSTGPSHVDMIVSTLNWFGVYMFLPWIINNILSDLNDKVWDKVKKSFKNVLSAFYDKEKGKNVGFVFWVDNRQALFIFDLKLNKEVIINSLEDIPIIIKDIKNNKYIFLSLIFELDKNTGKWLQTNNKHVR